MHICELRDGKGFSMFNCGSHTLYKMQKGSNNMTDYIVRVLITVKNAHTVDGARAIVMGRLRSSPACRNFVIEDVVKA